MKEKILLRKTYSIYASDIHLATMIFPFVDKEIERGAIIKPILEKDISNSIEKIIENIGLKYEMKNRIAKIDWSQTNIDKIKGTLEQMEEELLQKQVIHIIVSGTNLFIDNNPSEIKKFLKVSNHVIRIRREEDKYSKLDSNSREYKSLLDVNL